MPTTPPLDNKQEPVEYTTDPFGPYNDKEAREFHKRLREFACANDMGEKTKAFNAAYDAFYALLSVHPELIRLPDMVSVDELKIGMPVFKSVFSFDEIKRKLITVIPMFDRRNTDSVTE